MAVERTQHRISRVLTRLASGFSTFILAVILSTHYNPLGPNISPGELASQNSLPIVVAKTEIPIGSLVIPEGYRAMTVRVADVVGLSGFIMPGALVDVVIVLEPSDESQKERISKIVLQNIKVLANGANLDKPENEKDVERVTTVTLQVTPEQAEKLAIALSEGKLQLVMR